MNKSESDNRPTEEDEEMREFVEAMWKAVNNPVILPEVEIRKGGDPSEIPDDASLAFLDPGFKLLRKNDTEQEKE